MDTALWNSTRVLLIPLTVPVSGLQLSAVRHTLSEALGVQPGAKRKARGKRSMERVGVEAPNAEEPSTREAVDSQVFAADPNRRMAPDAGIQRACVAQHPPPGREHACVAQDGPCGYWLLAHLGDQKLSVRKHRLLLALGVEMQRWDKFQPTVKIQTQNLPLSHTNFPN